MTTPTTTDAVFAELVLGGIPAGRAWEYAHCGVTPGEARETERLRIPFSEYTSARETGVTHPELVVVHLIGGQHSTLTSYIRARRNKMTHDQACERTGVYLAVGVPVEDLYAAHQAGCQVPGYAYARQIGATHDECLEIRRNGCSLGKYASARQVGVPHSECLEGIAAGCDLYAYGSAREAGATRAECLEAQKICSHLGGYAQARWAGATHGETLEAWRAGHDLYGYARERKAGKTHTESLTREFR